MVVRKSVGVASTRKERRGGDFEYPLDGLNFERKKGGGRLAGLIKKKDFTV